MPSINDYAPRSGRIIGEDGRIYNIVDLLQTGGGGGNMRFHFGEGAPEESLGAPGDVYLNSVNGDFYQNQNGTWTQIGTLRGPQGPQGPQGPEGPQGEQGPKGDPGEDGVGVVNITSDGTNITFHMSDGTTYDIPWPAQ